jgi:hypothetical protein
VEKNPTTFFENQNQTRPSFIFHAISIHQQDDLPTETQWRDLPYF